MSEETLSMKERLEFIKVVNHGRKDPIWFLEEMIGWKTMFPMQKEIIQTFYQSKYDSSLPKYKKLVARCGQRCLSASTFILTKEYGHITISEVFDKFHSGEIIHVKNPNGWVKVGDAFYTGFKPQYIVVTSDKKSIECSIDHKFFVNNQWAPLKDIKSGDVIKVYDPTYHTFYNTIVIGWDQEEYTVEMYDLCVPEGNCYVANGFLTHNSGKTVLGSKIAIYEFFELVSLDNPAEYYGLIKNQEIAINCIAAGKEQALEGMFSLMRNDIEGNEWFNQWFDLKITEGKITCDKKHVYAKVAAARADSGSGTGTTSKLSLLDEVDLFQRTDSKVGSEVVISKALNATKTLGLDGKFVAISSTQFTDGAITKLYMDGQNESDTLVYNLPTWIMNPKFTKETLMEEYKYKMHMFWRDFANQPEVSGGLMFPNGVRFNKSIPNVFFAPDDIIDEYAQFNHVISLDPAFRNDAFGIACGFVSGTNIVIDGARKYTKENEAEAFIKPSDMEHEIESWVERLNVTTLLFDADIILNIIEKAQDQWGIETVKNVVGEKEYGAWLSMNDGIGEYTLDVTYDEHAKREVEQLVKSQLPSGKIRVDHPFSGSKDVADAICQTIYFLSQNNMGRVVSPVIPGFATF